MDFLVTIIDLLSFLCCTYWNHHSKFEIDLSILKCLNLRKELTVTDRRTDLNNRKAYVLGTCRVEVFYNKIFFLYNTLDNMITIINKYLTFILRSKDYLKFYTLVGLPSVGLISVRNMMITVL